ncbi:DUF3016 domain-containing protein [Glaciecola sp. SC05]|uniref:DUF3016 domain-containing protein n=1 Tax=Glaciecola sp. SC05 TaxID=1987355 RepID=UPI0035282ECA
MKLNKCCTSITALAVSLLLFSNAQAGSETQQVSEATNIKIEFIEPESYTDMRPSNESRSRYHKHVLSSIEEHFAELSENLPDGQTLDIKVTDIDLAGDTRSPRIPVGSFMFDVRVMEDIFFPRIKFNYVLKNAAGEVLQSEDVNLKDMAYLNRAGVVRRNSGSFPYEKFMLQQWFKDTFESKAHSAS